MIKPSENKEVKLLALDDLSSGMGRKEVASKYGVSVPTVAKWKQAAGMTKIYNGTRKNAELEKRRLINGWNWVWVGKEVK